MVPSSAENGDGPSPTTTEAVELSVVLVNHNGDCSPDTLRALASNTATKSLECIVVDSGSTDGSWKQIEQHWSRARVLRFEENVGFCVGCNRGAEAARGRLVAFVNADGEVEPNWDRPLRALLEDPQVQVATGLILNFDGKTIQAAGLEIAPNMALIGRQLFEPRHRAPDSPVDVPAPSAALMMVRRSDFLARGGLREDLWMYGDETDYALRACKHGRIVLHPASAVRHEFGRTTGPHLSPFRLYWSTRNRLINAAYHLPITTMLQSLLASAAFDLVTAWETRSFRSARVIARAWFDALRMIPRERRKRTRQDGALARSRLISFPDAVREYRRIVHLWPET
jgi:GT2 family glycosyltransferase